MNFLAKYFYICNKKIIENKFGIFQTGGSRRGGHRKGNGGGSGYGGDGGRYGGSSRGGARTEYRFQSQR